MDPLAPLPQALPRVTASLFAVDAASGMPVLVMPGLLGGEEPDEEAHAALERFATVLYAVKAGLEETAVSTPAWEAEWEGPVAAGSRERAAVVPVAAFHGELPCVADTRAACTSGAGSPENCSGGAEGCALPPAA